MFIKFEDCKLMEYASAYEHQLQNFNYVLANRENAEYRGNLLFVEHPHVFTLGNSGDESNLLVDMLKLNAENIQFFKTNRGGDITYHGFGQIVGYPILDLSKCSFGIKEYVNKLEETVIRTMLDFGVACERLSGATGVWIEPSTPRARKICAIGIRASRQVTMHGFALNINTDLKYFDLINPCGFVDKGVTSLSKELNMAISIDEVKPILLKNFSEVFDSEIL